MALKDGNHCDIVWEELNSVSGSGVAGKRLQGRSSNALFLNVSGVWQGWMSGPLQQGSPTHALTYSLGPSQCNSWPPPDF